MPALVRLIIIGSVIEIAGILSFIGIAKTALDVPGKQITMFIFVIAVIGLLIVAVKQLSFKELLFLAFFLTIVFTGIFQILGYAFFPGLVKDIELFSPEHLEGLVPGMVILFSCYMGSIFVILAAQKLLKI